MSGTESRYEVSFYVGPCTEADALALADRILELFEFNAVGGGGVGISRVVEDDAFAGAEEGPGAD